jgi:hypothetical protein
MCFTEDNMNFINIKFRAEMKGLSDTEKLAKYELIKVESRRRLKESYIKCSKKLDFYSEAFDELSFFESDYLMLNLFLEREANALFTFLSSNSFENLNFKDQESISCKFWVFMRTHSDVETVSEFLKTEFIDLLSISEGEWISENKENNPIINGYAKWLIKSIENEVNNEQVIFTYFLFSKLWNHFSLFTEQFNAKAIIFYNTIIKQFDELKNQGIYFNLKQLIDKIKENQHELFANEKIYFPLLDNQDNDNYCSGYLNQRNEFNKRIKQSEILCSSYIDKPFHFIFNLMLNKEKAICIKLYQKDIVGKLNKFHLPDNKEIRQICDSEKDENIDKFKKDLFRRLYIFEQL